MRYLLPLIILFCGCEKPSAYTVPRKYEFTPPTIKVPRPTPSVEPVVKPSPWETVRIRKEKLHAAQTIAHVVEVHKTRYDAVASAVNVPYDVIGGLHYREADFDWKSNLANGDPLTAPTRHVPKGRPPNAKFPVSWEYAAIDALRFDKLDREDWSTIPHTLNNVEAYNGLGYSRMGKPSPYVWSWTDKYRKGKYVADGKYDPEAIDQQCGVAPILKLLE